jgi:hypothetical protein
LIVNKIKKPVLYAKLRKAIYRTIKAALLFWTKLAQLVQLYEARVALDIINKLSELLVLSTNRIKCQDYLGRNLDLRHAGKRIITMNEIFIYTLPPDMNLRYVAKLLFLYLRAQNYMFFSAAVFLSILVFNCNEVLARVKRTVSNT